MKNDELVECTVNREEFLSKESQKFKDLLNK